MFKKFWHWIKSFFTTYYEVTIWFEGSSTIHPDGSRTVLREPKQYECKKIVKLTNTHIKLIDKDDCKIEIKTIEPVGFDVKEPKSPPLN